MLHGLASMSFLASSAPISLLTPPVSSPVLPNPQIQIPASCLAQASPYTWSIFVLLPAQKIFISSSPSSKFSFLQESSLKKLMESFKNKSKMLRKLGRNKQYILFKRRNMWKNRRFWESWLISFYTLKKFLYDLAWKSEVKVLVTQLCPTLCDPMDVAHQAPLSMEFSRQEYWSG